MNNVEPTIGERHMRHGSTAARRRQRAEGTSSRSNPEVATFTTLRPHSDGGYAPTEMGCSRRDYLEEEEEDEEFEPK